VPVGLAAQGFVESSSGYRDRRERPRCRGLDEEPTAIDKISRNGAP